MLAAMEINMTTPKNCVFCTATNRLIDFIPDNSDGSATIARLVPEYGSALIILPVVDAWQRHENSCKSEPVEITRDRFHEMLNILPPVAWNFSDPPFESFKMSERTTARSPQSSCASMIVTSRSPIRARCPTACVLHAFSKNSFRRTRCDVQRVETSGTKVLSPLTRGRDITSRVGNF